MPLLYTFNQESPFEKKKDWIQKTHFICLARSAMFKYESGSLFWKEMMSLHGCEPVSKGAIHLMTKTCTSYIIYLSPPTFKSSYSLDCGAHLWAIYDRLNKIQKCKQCNFIDLLRAFDNTVHIVADITSARLHIVTFISRPTNKRFNMTLCKTIRWHFNGNMWMILGRGVVQNVRN